MSEVNATPHTELIAELINPNNPKNEREHAAVREIERLQEAHPVKDLEDIDINITWNENSMRDFGKDELNFARAILGKAQAYLKGFDEASTPSFKAKERLIRIMGTFDLATGHANTFDELLDSLESELRDVLGHYREALAQPERDYERGFVDTGEEKNNG